MLRCAWCMKKIKGDQPVFGLSVKFAEGVDFLNSEGTITQIRLQTRNTSVPLIIAGRNSEAKNRGSDGIFAICSEKCGEKMKDTLTKELTLFEEFKEISLK